MAVGPPFGVGHHGRRLVQAHGHGRLVSSSSLFRIYSGLGEFCLHAFFTEFPVHGDHLHMHMLFFFLVLPVLPFDSFYDSEYGYSGTDHQNNYFVEYRGEGDGNSGEQCSTIVGDSQCTIDNQWPGGDGTGTRECHRHNHAIGYARKSAIRGPPSGCHVELPGPDVVGCRQT